MRNGKNNNASVSKSGAAVAAEHTDTALYNALRAVFIDEAYCAQALTKALKGLTNLRSHPFVTSAFYGVLDNNVRLDKTIEGLCEKAPDKNATVVLKIGLFYCNYADMPIYAAVNRAVELAKRVGVYSGFVNAVLKRSVDFKPRFKNGAERFSYETNTPEWLCREIVNDYGETRAASILGAELSRKTHIRPVSKRITADAFKAAAKGDFTEYGCYCEKSAIDGMEQGTYAVQSVSSIRAVNTYVKGINGGDVLDLCAAPGGKSVYMSELGDYKITACDIYPHKLELMRGYAKKLGARIEVALNDATVFNPKFADAFDLVVADCPCSGTGTLKSKPDIMIRRKPADIAELCGLQTSILNEAAKYCRKSGVLCYSTCSILCRENEATVSKFLADHSEYTLIDETKLLPDTDGCDGFYIARFKRGEA